VENGEWNAHVQENGEAEQKEAEWEEMIVSE